MTQNQLDCFYTAVRTGSLTATARELFLSVQTVSTHIQNLEKEFSVTLFQRMPEGVTLTLEGQRFYRFAKAWSETYNHTIQSIENLYYNMSLKFTIAFSEWIDPLGDLSDAIKAFILDHEKTEVTALHIDNGALIRKLEQEEIDVAIMCDSQMSGGVDFDMVPFARESLTYYCPLWVQGDTIDTLDPVLPQIDASYGTWGEEETLEMSRRMSGNLGLDRVQCYTMPNFYSVIACAETVPCFVVSDSRFGHLRNTPDLRNLPLEKMQSSLCCVWNRKNENPLLPEFVAHMKDCYHH